MTAPERIWAKPTEVYGDIVIGEFADTVRYQPDGHEYILASHVTDMIRQAVEAVTHPGGWNPRYIAYAKDHGRGPAAQLEHDTKVAHGMMGFVRWVDRCIDIFKGQHPEAFAGGYLKDASAFDAWLEGLSVPIFARDEGDLLQRAEIMVGMLRMGERIAFGSDADMIADLAAAIRARGEG